MLDVSRFEEVQILGHGAFGSASIFRDIYSQKQEVIVMQTLKNKFVVRCYGYFLKEKSINIVMEYCQKGDLQKYIDELKKEHKIIYEQEFFYFAAQLASGISFFHSRKIIHRDLKPSNIFISGNNRLKIGDFGLSKVVDEQDYANTIIGTRIFLSPEMLQKWSYTEKVDQWSLGIILYILAELKYPFDISSEINLIQSISNQNPSPFMNMRNESAQKLILSLLNKDTARRPNAEEILQIPDIASQINMWKEKSQSQQFTRSLSLLQSLNIQTHQRENSDSQPLIISLKLDSSSLKFDSSSLKPDPQTQLITKQTDLSNEVQFTQSEDHSIITKYFNRISELKDEIADNIFDSNQIPKLKEILLELASILSQARKQPVEFSIILIDDVCGVICAILTDYILPDDTWNIEIIKEIQILIGTTLTVEDIKPIHVNSLKLFASHCSILLNKEMIEIGILQSIINNLKSRSSEVSEITSATIMEIINKEYNLNKMINPSKILSDMIEINVTHALFEDGLINSKTQIIKTNSAIALGWLYCGAQLPDSMNIVISHLKEVVKGGESINLRNSLSALNSLAQCQLNHAKILEDDFLKEIIQFLRSDDPKILEIFLQFLTTLANFGDIQTHINIQKFIPLTDLIPFAQNINESISINAKILCSWVSFKEDMEKFSNLIEQAKNKTIQEKTSIIKSGALKDVCSMLQIGKIGNIETEYAVIKACEAASSLLSWSSSSAQITQEEKQFINSLMEFLSVIPLNKICIQHLDSFTKNTGVNNELNIYLMEKGIFGLINKIMENQSETIIGSVLQSLSSIIIYHKRMSQISQQMSCFNQLEKDGTINRLQRIMTNSGFQNKNINKQSALTLCYIFKANPLPQDIQTDIANILIQILSDPNDNQFFWCINCIGCLSECQENHAILQSSNIYATIIKFLHLQKTQSKQNLVCYTYILCDLFKWGTDETINEFKKAIQVDVIRELINHKDSVVRLNSNEVLSWIVKTAEMKRMAKLIQDFRYKNQEKIAEAVEQGILKEICEILERINKNEDGMAGVADPVCFAISLIFEGNPQFTPEALEQGRIVDHLISIIDSSSTKQAIFNQIESVRVIVNELQDEQLHILFDRGQILTISKHLGNEEPSTRYKASEKIERIIQSGISDINDGDQNPFRKQMEEDGTIQKIIGKFKSDKSINKMVNFNIALTIALLFKAFPLPPKYSSIVVNLKINCRDLDENLCSKALSALACLAQCEDQFAKQILQHIKDKTKEKTCIAALRLVSSIVKHGSSDTKSAIRTDIPIATIHPLSFNKSKEIQQVAKEICTLLKN